MNVQTRHIRSFIAVVLEKSFARGASRLNVSQLRECVMAVGYRRMENRLAGEFIAVAKRVSDHVRSSRASA
jgi:hypothetical protein